ncbi:MAG: choline-sulfatase [Rhodospirillaceae bacterium]|nr:choline-sulfatase [Rhodospirillaceae bacterium]
MVQSTQPNFLFIQTDQMTAFALGQYGNPVCKTPNIDKLAAEGVVFDNAYCNNPICASSRFSMMSGQLSSRVGAYDNAAEFPAQTPTFAHYLVDLGYTTCLSGKMHFVGPDQLHGFQERVTTDIYPSDFGWTPDWLCEGLQPAPSGMSMRSVVEAGVSERSLQIDYDEETCHQAEVKLWEYARCAEPKPFFLAVSFTHPHNPFTTQSRYWDLYDHDEINMPTVPAIPVKEKDPWSQRYYYLIRNDEHDVSAEDVRNARHAYYGMVTYMDDMVGRLIKVLNESGLRENTVVIFTADHGDMLGERGMWYKFNPYEWSVRIPLIISAPKGFKGKHEKTLVSLVDMLPTFADMGGAGSAFKPVDKVDGRSLRPLLYDEGSEIADEVMIEFTAEGTYAPALILRQGAYKYVYCETDPGMMFNLDDDPNELNNLCNDPGHSDKAAKMEAEILRRWDPVQLKQDIIASQQRRHFVQRILMQGTSVPWDFQPEFDASKQYLRTGNSPTKVKGLARYPFVSPKPPDKPR